MMWPFSPRQKSFTDFPNAVSSAAFRFIGMPSLWPSYLGGAPKQIEERKAHIERKHREAERLPEGDLRDCVLAYLRYYERKLPEEERELVEQISRKRLDAYKERRAKEENAISAILKENGL